MREWMQWADENGNALKNAGVVLPDCAMPKKRDNCGVISSDPTQATFGLVDGWHAAFDPERDESGSGLGQSGYVFLFNQGFLPRNITLT